MAAPTWLNKRLVIVWFKFICFWQRERIGSKRKVAGEGRQQVKGQEVVRPLRVVEKSKMLTFFGASVTMYLVFHF